MKNILASILRSTPEWQIEKENEKSAQKPENPLFRFGTDTFKNIFPFPLESIFSEN
jgi:hypothetical protein